MHESEILDIKFPNLHFKQIYDVQETFTREVNSFLFTILKYCPKKSCYATLGKPKKTFVAFLDNKFTLLI